MDTGRSRTYAISGTGQTRGRIESFTKNSQAQRVPHTCTGICTTYTSNAVNDTTHVVDDRINPATPGDPNNRQVKVTFTPKATLAFPFLSPSTQTYTGTDGDTGWLDYTSTGAVAQSPAIELTTLDIDWNFTENGTYYEYLNTGYFERRELTSYSITGTVSATYTVSVYQGGGSTLTGTSSVTATGTKSIVPADLPGANSYDAIYSYTLQVGGGTTSLLVGGFPFFPYVPNSGGLALVDVTTTFSLSASGLSTSGPTTLTMPAAGTTLYQADPPLVADDSGISTIAWPVKIADVSPNWSLRIVNGQSNYADGSTVAAGIDIVSGTVIGHASSGSYYDYPSGHDYTNYRNTYTDGIIAGKFDYGGNPYGGTYTIYGVFTLGIEVDSGSSRTYGASGYDTDDNSLHTFMTAVDDGGGNITLRYNMADLDTIGNLADSKNFPWDGRLPDIQQIPEFNIATLGFASTHQFKVFDDSTQWSVYSDPFLSSYHTAGTLSTVSGATKAVITNSPVLLRSSQTLKNFAYRYVKLRVKSSVAGAQFRFWVGSSSAGDTPHYAWSFTVDQADTWETKELDLGLPHSENTATILGVMSVVSSSHINHPADWQTTGQTPLWIDCLTNGDHYFDYIEGFYRPDPTNVSDDTSRTPLLIVDGLDCRGDSTNNLEDYETNATNYSTTFPVLYTLYNAILYVNGVKGINFKRTYTGTQVTWYDYWTTFFNYLDDTLNDTGITVTRVNNTFTNYFSTNGICSKINGFGTSITPGSSFTFKAEPKYRVANHLNSVADAAAPYYGMGDPLGSYGTRFIYTAKKAWNGEINGLVHGAHRGIKGSVLNLEDNNAGTLVTSGTSDADGFFRLKAHYGVVLPHQNSPYGGSFISREAYTAGPVYTTQGLKMNSYWMKGTGIIIDKDSSNYFKDLNTHLRDDFIILDRFPGYLDFTGIRSGGFLDTKRHPDSSVYTAYVGDTIKIVRQRDMNSLSDTIDTGKVGTFPNIEVWNGSGRHYLFYVDSLGDITYLYSDNDFTTRTDGMSLASDATTLFVHKDSQMAILYLVWVTGDSHVKCMKLSPSGDNIPFSDASTSKQISTITASAAGVIVKNGIVCLKYVDASGDIQQLFSKDSAETWSSTF